MGDEMEERDVEAVRGEPIPMLKVARAAIAAMREPTEAMIEAGATASWYSDEHGMAWRLPSETVEQIWRAMIDAALLPPANGE